MVGLFGVTQDIVEDALRIVADQALRIAAQFGYVLLE